MALASSVTKRLGAGKTSAWGGIRTNIVRFTFDATYPDGGYTITPALCGFLTQVLVMLPMGLIHDATTTSAETGWYVSYDQVLGKLQVFDAGAGNSTSPPGEVADNFATIDTLVCDFVCMGV